MLQRLLLTLFLLAMTLHLHAATLEELVEQEKVSVDIKLVESGELVVGQELTVTLTFATQTWFKGANRFTLPEIPNAVVVQRDTFGSNETQRINGETWVMQHKRFSVFPQTSGRFEIPAIKIDMKVFVPGVGDVSGEVYSKPLNFEVSVPAELAFVDTWWPAKSFKVSEQWDKSFDVLKPGFSIERTITIEADGLLAMMLPEINHPPIKGLAHYVKPPQLLDDNTRGNKLAKRIQKIDYVVEESGEVVIPSVEFTWYNTESQTVEYITIEAQVVELGQLSPKEKLIKLAKQMANYWQELVVGLLIFIVLIYAWKKLSIKRVKPRYQASKVKGQLAQASHDKNARRFIKWAYVYLDWFSGADKVNLLRAEKIDSNTSLNGCFDSVFAEQGKQPVKLTSALKYVLKTKRVAGKSTQRVDLSMNPKD
ncbi:BatD family protein [Thalassotalea sp. LPB0316]|uniref:BatD family protein n=1 Tax=Thalassotalea sp. LPB0316 TaxID=2769490 RepID=UPI001D03D8BB|nr:BatD family protein [Thalassotalea sp. LPB0316]